MNYRKKKKRFLYSYYYEDLTLKEIGKVLEVTESRISQLHTKAIMRLRAKLTNIKKGRLCSNGRIVPYPGSTCEARRKRIRPADPSM